MLLAAETSARLDICDVSEGSWPCTDLVFGSCLLLVTANDIVRATTGARFPIDSLPLQGYRNSCQPGTASHRITWPTIMDKQATSTRLAGWDSSRVSLLPHIIDQYLGSVEEGLRSALSIHSSAMVIHSGMCGDRFAMGLRHFAMFHCRVASRGFENTPRRGDRHSLQTPVFPAVLKDGNSTGVDLPMNRTPRQVINCICIAYIKLLLPERTRRSL